MVSSKEECEIAATSLMLKVKTISARGNKPGGFGKGASNGCIYGSNDWLAWAGLKSTEDTPNCGYGMNVATYDCLCRVHGIKSSSIELNMKYTIKKL